MNYEFLARLLMSLRPNHQPSYTPNLTAPFGYPIRSNLYPSERDFFRSNPGVTGRASFEDNAVTLNPYSNLTPTEKQGVANNEAARLRLNAIGITPSFSVTADQKKRLAGSAYPSDPSAMRQTIAARGFSGDPNMPITPEQRAFINFFLIKYLKP